MCIRCMSYTRNTIHLLYILNLKHGVNSSFVIYTLCLCVFVCDMCTFGSSYENERLPVFFPSVVCGVLCTAAEFSPSWISCSIL